MLPPAPSGGSGRGLGTWRKPSQQRHEAKAVAANPRPLPTRAAQTPSCTPSAPCSPASAANPPLQRWAARAKPTALHPLARTMPLAPPCLSTHSQMCQLCVALTLPLVHASRGCCSTPPRRATHESSAHTTRLARRPTSVPAAAPSGGGAACRLAVPAAQRHPWRSTMRAPSKPTPSPHGAVASPPTASTAHKASIAPPPPPPPRQCTRRHDRSGRAAIRKRCSAGQAGAARGLPPPARCNAGLRQLLERWAVNGGARVEAALPPRSGS